MDADLGPCACYAILGLLSKPTGLRSLDGGSLGQPVDRDSAAFDQN
jgi:hypothetical protein